MKYLIALFFFVSLAASIAQSAERGVAADEFLSRAEARKVLQAIDSRCGDTWCEGDFSFQFPSLECRARESACSVRVQMTPFGAQTRDFACELRASTYADLVDDRGISVELRAGPYQQLSDCIVAHQS